MSESSDRERAALTDVQLCDVVEATVRVLEDINRALMASDQAEIATETLRRRLREESEALCRESTEMVGRLRSRLDSSAA